MTRTCEHCGTDITHKKSNARFCSRIHKAAAWDKVRDKQKKAASIKAWKERNPNYLSPGYLKQHNTNWKKELACFCGNTFIPNTASQIHCSSFCKKKHNKLLTKIQYYKQHYGEDIWEKTMTKPSARFKDKYRIARELGYRSGLEVSFARFLEENNIPFKYEDIKIQYVQPQKTRIYKPDFVIGTIILETKGRLDSADRQKHLWIKEQHPELDIRFVFYDETAKLSKRSKTTYAQWCEKFGFKYCTFRTGIPEEWQKDLKSF